MKVSIPKLKSNLSKYGFVIIKNYISKYKINKVLDQLGLIFCNEIKKNKDKNYKKLFWKDKNFSEDIIKLRKKNPYQFSKVYNFIKNNPNYIDLVNDKKIISLAANLLNVKKYNIWNGEFTLRIDTPNDKRNTLGWHQDSRYYPQHTTDGKNGLVFSITLSDIINKKNGALQICPKSQKLGLMKSKKVKINIKKYKTKFSSETFQIENKLVKKYFPKTINSNKGDLVIMDLNLIHRSGYNSSKLSRISSISRLFDISSKSHPLN